MRRTGAGGQQQMMVGGSRGGRLQMVSGLRRARQQEVMSLGSRMDGQKMVVRR